MGGAKDYTRISNRRLTVSVCGRKSIICAYALVYDLRLITRDYGTLIGDSFCVVRNLHVPVFAIYLDVYVQYL